MVNGALTGCVKAAKYRKTLGACPAMEARREAAAKVTAEVKSR
jgi:hypothetical protein